MKLMQMISQKQSVTILLNALSIGWGVMAFCYAFGISSMKEWAQFVVLILILTLIYEIVRYRRIIDLVLCVGLSYGLAGGANYIDRGAQVDYLNEIFFLLTFTAIFIGHKFIELLILPGRKKGPVLNAGEKNLYFSKRLSQLDVLILFIGIVAMLADWYQIGTLPILVGEEDRYGSKPAFRAIFFLSLSWLAYIFCVKNSKIFIKTLIGIFFILILGSGYRTNGFYLIGFLALFRFSSINMSFRSMLAIFFSGIIVLGALSGLKLYRDITQYGDIDELQEIVASEGLPPEMVWASPILHTVREGPQMFQQVRENLPKYGLGDYFIDNITTALPGQQYGYGMQYNLITHAVSNKTKVATLPAAFYIDGGWWFVLLGSFCLGVFSGFHYVLARDNIHWRFLYVFVVTHFGVWFHSGVPFQPSSVLAYFGLFFLMHKSLLASPRNVLDRKLQRHLLPSQIHNGWRC